MPAPFSEQFYPVNTPEVALERRIDDHYHLAMIAERSEDIVGYQSKILNAQYATAVANIRGMAAIASNQAQTNDMLASLGYGIDGLRAGVDDLNATASETLDAVYAQTDIIREGLSELADLLLQQGAAIRNVADILRKPYETQALELIKEAERALKQGMKSTGRTRKAEFDDAKRLTLAAIENPIGSRNFIVWFQQGWLQWKIDNNIEAAEESFFQSRRLNVLDRNPQYREENTLLAVNSIRHMAYMQYLQSKYEDAYQTIQEAHSLIFFDYDICYDTARYAARTGRQDEALARLDDCIDLQPQTIVTMFSEGDFLQ